LLSLLPQQYLKQSQTSLAKIIAKTTPNQKKQQKQIRLKIM
jgi:hypothetical protein